MICFVITSHYDLSKENRNNRDIEEIVLLFSNCPVSFATNVLSGVCCLDSSFLSWNLAYCSSLKKKKKPIPCSQYSLKRVSGTHILPDLKAVPQEFL